MDLTPAGDEKFSSVPGNFNAIFAAAQRAYQDFPGNINFDFKGWSPVTEQTYRADPCSYSFHLVATEVKNPPDMGQHTPARVEKLGGVHCTRFLLLINEDYTHGFTYEMPPTSPTPRDVQGILAHEFGHVLNLAHTGIFWDIMNTVGYGRPDATSSGLTYRTMAHRWNFESILEVLSQYGIRDDESLELYDYVAPGQWVFDQSVSFTQKLWGPASCTSFWEEQVDDPHVVAAISTEWTNLAEKTVTEPSTEDILHAFGSFRRPHSIIDPGAGRLHIVAVDPLSDRVLLGQSGGVAEGGSPRDYFVTAGNTTPPLAFAVYETGLTSDSNVAYVSSRHPASIAIDTASDRVVAAWAAHAPGCALFHSTGAGGVVDTFCRRVDFDGTVDDLIDNRVYIGTRPPGNTHDPLVPSDLGVYSMVGPAVACAPETETDEYRCVLGYVDDTWNVRFLGFDVHPTTGQVFRISGPHGPTGGEHTYNELALAWGSEVSGENRFFWGFRGLDPDTFDSAQRAWTSYLDLDPTSGSMFFPTAKWTVTSGVRHAPSLCSQSLTSPRVRLLVSK